MNKNFMSLEELFEGLTQNLSVAAINAARLLSHISNSIINARSKRKMKQIEFAEIMGVSQSMISKWESGDYNFTIKQLCEICEKLDITPYIELRESGYEKEYIPENREFLELESRRLHKGQAYKLDLIGPRLIEGAA